MKTKHLLFATALVASFAACSNEDLFEAPQNVAKDGRPTVSDVKLNFTEGGAQTRLTFGSKGYAWEATDVIGALLMDEVASVNPNDSWIEKYALVPYIHTSYPFTYSTEDKTWSCNAKMLEGNYFFAFPWESYDGVRQVTHSITGQKQNGVKSNVVAESYAKNQFFVGYSQIKAGKDAKDVLDDVEMTPVLGAIRLDIVNTGTQTYHINKIVLKGDDLASVLTVDPTQAGYSTYNLDNANAVAANGKFKNAGEKYFNYANYTGNEDDVYDNAAPVNKVYNGNENYNRQVALTAAVNKVGADEYAQLLIEGTSTERELVSTKKDEEAVAYALIMANPDANVAAGELILDIYCDEGIVAGIDLSRINLSSASYGYVTDSKVTAIGPNVKNTIRVQVDDNSFEVPDAMNIYRSEDLKQFIKWNARINGSRTIKATLKENITLDKEAYDMLVAGTNVTLTIEHDNAGPVEVLTLAKELPADALDYSKLMFGTNIPTVAVEGALTLTKDTKGITTLNVLEGASLAIETKDAIIPTTINNAGTLKVGAEAIVASTKTIVNDGIVNVEKGADVKATFTNVATLNNSGYMRNVTNNADAVVNLGEGASLLNVVVNNGTINTAKNAQVSGTNDGLINYVDGAAVVVTGTGMVAAAAPATVNADTYKSVAAINALIINKGLVSVTTDVTKFATIYVKDGAELSVAKGKTLKATMVEIEGEATISGQGVVEAVNVTVKEEASLTNNGTIYATTAFTNNGMVYNYGTVKATNYTTLTSNWKYNPAVNYTPAATPTPTSTCKLNVTIDSSAPANSLGTSLSGQPDGSTINVKFQTLKDFYLFMSNKQWKDVTTGANESTNYTFPANTAATVETITINTALTLTDGTTKDSYGRYNESNHYSYLKELAAEKDVIINNVTIDGLKHDMELSFNSLTAKGTLAKVDGVARLVTLTVGKLVIASSTDVLEIDNTWVKISGKSQVNVGSDKIVTNGGTLTLSNTGKIVTEDNTGDLIEWDKTYNKWKGLS